ncbi:hypothetical protein WICMUC_004962 [Wickerhamomyces mucosus]|uniref:Uncharacterized protein n=1 Tax=Wickerhamomyces mucosus TaxID=1378264 RepID=A0A9P8PD80_9ASCO|nr:hypothetical protein WICMUC_004962 [Wickerhamomyces mucosus]
MCCALTAGSSDFLFISFPSDSATDLDLILSFGENGSSNDSFCTLEAAEFGLICETSLGRDCLLVPLELFISNDTSEFGAKFSSETIDLNDDVAFEVSLGNGVTDGICDLSILEFRELYDGVTLTKVSSDSLILGLCT